MNNYNETQDGNVAVSWSKALALDITDDVELFRIRFDVKKVSELQNVLSISSDLTRAEAYDADLNKMNLELNFRNLEKAGEFTLYQNSPNPFSESTVISFFMKEAGVATISIYDLNGKVLKVMELLKVVLQGGWCLNQPVIEEILKAAGVSSNDNQQV